MKILPDREQGKPLAIGLALVALIVVYLVGFHWFVQRHMQISEQAGSLKEQIARAKAMSMQRDDVEAQLEELRVARHDSALFLPQPTFATAAAGLSRQLREIIAAEADDEEFCQVQASQPRPSQEEERFEPVTVNVRMNCPLPDFVRVLHRLEDNIPLIFIDNLSIMQRVAQGSQRARRGGDPALLDIRFDMYGYLPQAAAE